MKHAHWRSVLSRIKLLGGIIIFSSLCSLAEAVHIDVAARLDNAIAGKHREPQNTRRDVYRHPKETLSFFGLYPTMHVVEIWPSRGWYTEIIVPVLRDHGRFYAASFSTEANRTPEWRLNMHQRFLDKLKAHPEIYDQTVVTGLSIPEDTDMAPKGSADMVLTFRNVHNWMKGDYAQQMFDAIAAALKPGGILGVVEHRAKPGTSMEQMIRSGYVTESHVIRLARNAGLILVDSSEVNANPKDTTDHPKGVWTLPPSLRLGEQERDKYLAIGESDRMTLKFVKVK